MKSIAHYSIASLLFVAVFFFLLFMNLVSILMLRKVNRKEDDQVTDTYYFAGYELARS